MKLTHYDFPVALDINNILGVKQHIKDMHRFLVALAKVDTLKLNEIAIKQLVDKRCDDLLNDTSKMIDSILTRKKHSIVLDRLLINNKDTGEKRFTIDPDEIKHAVTDHFQNFAIPNSRAYPMSRKWKAQYRPKDYINDNWYSNLMQPPTFDEWLAVLKSLPSDKAAGPSGITNEMISHLGSKTQHLLWQLICMCFSIGEIPNE